ncbi:MAG: sulfate adenylyltransferase [Salinisphaera sp.]|nr:sulfate adenylyltransferase [Salinisphaera sp.]
MIKPHGSETLNPLFVADRDQRQALLAEAQTLPCLTLSSAAAANAVMLGAGYFNPLTGYMDKADALAVGEDLHTRSGLFWPVPILNLTDDAAAVGQAERIALRDPNVPGAPVIAIQDVAGVDHFSENEIETLAGQIFSTSDRNHPGVATFTALGRHAVHGPIQVLNFSYFETDFPATFRTAPAIRAEFAERGWDKVIAFQTRNPMHRAHEELCKMALEATGADGLLIHMLLGKLKAGDVPADVRDTAIRTMVEHYFAPNTVMIAGYGFDMLYAGPREAVLHATFRQNAGASYLVVGRDHAGVGGYYGPFDSQKIFDEKVPPGALEIEIFAADHTAYSKKLERVVMMRDVPDHGQDDFVILSGTAVRKMLSEGQAPPPEFSRPEVAQILMDHYQSGAAAG